VLELLSLAIDGDKKRTTPIQIDHSTALDPVVVSCPNLPHALVIVMPMRTDEAKPSMYAEKIKSQHAAEQAKRDEAERDEAERDEAKEKEKKTVVRAKALRDVREAARDASNAT
jgi:hypothetical protein